LRYTYPDFRTENIIITMTNQTLQLDAHRGDK
jgi:hypothetical protein